jgi:Ca2+-binding EF-hand superfamily protein
MGSNGGKSYSELQTIKSDIEAAFAKSKGQLEALSDSQLGIIAEQYGIEINPSDRLQTLKTLQSNESISAWRLPFSKIDVAVVASAAAAGGAVGVASQLDNAKDELQQKATQTAREKIANASSSVVENIERKASDNPMVEMIRKNFGQSLIQAGYSVPELTKMLDVDADGIITQAEIMLLLVKMTGTPPPPWVVTSIFEILDRNQDGIVTVEEWWAFLEEMGFGNEAVSLPTPEVVEEKSDIDEIFEEINNMEEEIPLQQVVESPIPIAETMDVEDSPTVILDENVNTNNENIIQQLLSARLSSDEREIITGAKNSICSVKIERVERTLMVTDHYRGGHSVLGILDGGSNKVLIMLPKSENDVVTKFNKGDIVEVDAVIVSWSSGLKIAKMAGTDARKV